jgi:mRNA interferase RelE/StbE
MKASFKIVWKESAIKELKQLPKKERINVIQRVEKLATDPFPHGAIKLSGSEYTFRFRVGSYRVIYEVLNKILRIDIIRVRHRKDVYR